jgi:CysZ protein
MFFKDLFSGIGAYGQAFGLINKLKLWRYFLVPAIVGLLLGTGIIYGALTVSDPLGAKLASYWPFEFGKDFMLGFSQWLSAALLLFIGLIIFKNLILIASSPFMTPVSEKVEAHIRGHKLNLDTSAKVFMEQLGRAAKINGRNLILEIIYTLLFLLLHFIPLIGSLASTFFIFRLQAYFVGFGNMDYTLERYFNYSDSVAFVKRHKGVAIGNGFLFMLMLFIPVIGVVLVLPLSTVSSTVETIKKLDAEGVKQL